MEQWRTLAVYFVSLLVISCNTFCAGESTHRYKAYAPYYTSVFQQNAEVDEVINHHGSRLRREEASEPEESILPQGYNPLVPPLFSSIENEQEVEDDSIDIETGTIDVNASVIIFNVRDVNEVSEDYNLEVNLRLYWTDKRLESLSPKPGDNFRVLNYRLLDKIWTPDIYIDHVKNTSQPALISKPSSLRIYPGGNVRYSARMTVKMSCQMDFTYYPADTQACTVALMSFSFKKDKLHLGWERPPNFALELVNRSVSQNFEISVSEGRQLDVPNPFSRRGQKFCSIEFDLYLRRKLTFHFWQTFFPSTLFVITSWTSFWVPPEIVSARTTVCMSSLLTQTMMFSSVRQNTPNESYAKALDVWMLVCMFFGFLTLLEYTVILKLNSLKPKEKNEDKEEEDDENKNWFNWRNLNFNILKRKDEDDDPANSITPVSYLSWHYIDGKDFVPYHIRRPKLKNSRASSPISASNNSLGCSSSSQSLHQRSVSPQSQGSPQPTPEKSKKPEDDLTKYKKFTIAMDRVSRFAFPGAFVLFNLIYWPTLLIKSAYYS